MIYIINVKVWIDHIFQSIFGVFSLFSFVRRPAILFVGRFVGEILGRVRVIPVIHRDHCIESFLQVPEAVSKFNIEIDQLIFL